LARFAYPAANHTLTSPNSANITPRVLSPDGTFDRHSGLLHPHPSSPWSPRKMAPLPSGKRQRTTVDRDPEADDDLMHPSPSGSPSHRHELQHHQRHHLHQQTKSTPQGHLAAKAQPPVTVATQALMSRCHICSRKPNKKSDLDSFADCQGCGQRTCYVCIRECLGWGPNIANAITSDPTTPIEPTTPFEQGETSFTMLDADADDDQPQPAESRVPRHEHGWTRGGGHRQVVCSRCCVERGQDGEVVCLGCLPFVEG
jgi:hypothetical protein